NPRGLGRRSPRREAMKARLLALAVLLGAPMAAHATVQVPVTYTVDYKTFKNILVNTPITFELHTDAACATAAVVSQTINVQDIAHIDVLKRLTPKASLKAPQTAVLNHVLSGAPAEVPLYLSVLGSGVVPVGGSCQGQNSTVHYTTTDNTFVGQSAGSSNTTGSFNTAVGNQALKQNQTGISNTTVGNHALQNTTVSHNTAVGEQAMQNTTTGNPNVAVGEYALLNNTTGSANTAVGTSALSTNQTGVRNTAVGHGALQSSTSSDNVAVGQQAMQNATTGSFNVALGTFALQSNQTGISNTAVGQSALRNTTVSHNTAVGEQALQNDTTGTQNVGVGEYALINVTTGSNNVGVGVGATSNVTTGSNNISLGINAGASRTGGDSNNIDIGNAGQAGESNAIRIGNAGTAAATNVNILGIFGGGVNGSGLGVMVDNTGKLGVGISSARFKEDIQDLGDRTDDLMKLRTVRFHYKKDIDPLQVEEYGLVAEEVAKVYPNLVVNDDKGVPLTVRYHLLNAMLLNEVQKQARRLAAQEKLVAEQVRL